MGLFNKIFGESDNPKKEGVSWKTIASIEDLDQAIASSNQKTIAIFKHSTRCSISSMAKGRLERSWDINAEDLDLYYLDLIAYRPVSNAIAENLGVMHESPQILVIKNGKVIFHTSHNDISVGGIQAAIA